ncbi:MAG: HIT family protein [Bacteroidia bacterium]|nr:HIT family protein [Bacteroidia bacterium]
MSSIFSRIVSGEIPSYKIAEDDKHFAFLDINPLAKGHTLVIPKNEVDYIFDLNDQDYVELMTFSKRVAKALRKVMPCERIGMTVIGLEVPHAHVHLIPINGVGDMNFERPKLTFPEDEMKEIAEKVSKEFV